MDGPWGCREEGWMATGSQLARWLAGWLAGRYDVSSRPPVRSFVRPSPTIYQRKVWVRTGCATHIKQTCANSRSSVGFGVFFLR
jgi:hypothetical protein